MRTPPIIHVVSAHAEGEVGDVIVGGVSPPPGDTIWEQSRWVEQDKTLWDFMLNEPRGGVFRHVNLLVPAIHPEAHTGWIIMEPADMPPMSGSNSMCVATVLLETGIVPMVEPVTQLILEPPGGIVHVEAFCKDGKVEKVKVQNRPSFVDKLDAMIEVEGMGTLRVDTAYGGDSFVLIGARQLGFSLTSDEARDIAAMGKRITKAANEQLGFRHPEFKEWGHLSFCQMTGPVEIIDGVKSGRSSVTIEPGKIDRSPCGTGCSARMALMHARGVLDVGEPYHGLSLLGSKFECCIENETMVGDKNAIIPSITGRAWITGTHQHMLDPDDPWPTGYRLSDTWPNA